MAWRNMKLSLPLLRDMGCTDISLFKGQRIHDQLAFLAFLAQKKKKSVQGGEMIILGNALQG